VPTQIVTSAPTAKAIQLLVKGNAVILEWMLSPIAKDTADAKSAAAAFFCEAVTAYGPKPQPALA
jgi:hypothetical protein